MSEVGIKRRWTHVVPKITTTYWRTVMVDFKDAPPGMYGLDNMRADLHAELSKHYDLTHEQTSEVTNHMDKFAGAGRGGSMAMHFALQELWDKYPSST